LELDPRVEPEDDVFLGGAAPYLVTHDRGRGELRNKRIPGTRLGRSQ